TYGSTMSHASAPIARCAVDCDRASRRVPGRRPAGHAPKDGPLELEVDTDADLARPADDREVEAPGVTRIVAAVHVLLIEKVLSPQLDAVVASSGLIYAPRVQNPVRRLEHRLPVVVDQRALVGGVPGV